MSIGRRVIVVEADADLPRARPQQPAQQRRQVLPGRRADRSPVGAADERSPGAGARPGHRLPDGDLDGCSPRSTGPREAAARTGSALDWRSASGSSRPRAAGSGPGRARAAARPSASGCRSTTTRTSSSTTRASPEPPDRRSALRGLARPVGRYPSGMKPFRFLADAFDATNARELGERARAAQDLGVTTFVLPDHLVPQLAPIPYLATVAALADRLRIGAFVHNNDLRHPAVLAQDLATLDVLSEGRLDVAIGAGWNAPGVRGDRPAVRPDARPPGSPGRGDHRPQGLLRRGPVLVRGRALHDHRVRRLPEARPAAPSAAVHRRWRAPDAGARGPRGGHRRPGAADPVGAAGGPGVDHLGRDRGEARLGPGGRRRPVRLPRVQRLPVAVADHRHGRPPGEARKVIDRMRERTGQEMTEQEVIDSPHIFIGSVDRFVEKFSELRERLGVNSFLVGSLDELGRSSSGWPGRRQDGATQPLDPRRRRHRGPELPGPGRRGRLAGRGLRLRDPAADLQPPDPDDVRRRGARHHRLAMGGRGRRRRRPLDAHPRRRRGRGLRASPGGRRDRRHAAAGLRLRRAAGEPGRPVGPPLDLLADRSPTSIRPTGAGSSRTPPAVDAPPRRAPGQRSRTCSTYSRKSSSPGE